jgi:hypothetical protein
VGNEGEDIDRGMAAWKHIAERSEVRLDSYIVF